MISIRSYREADAAGVGRLIARTYSAFNLGFALPEQRDGLLGPFRFAESAETARRAAIAEAIGAPVVLVAEEDGALVGVLRGGRVDHEGRTVLQSLFVEAACHRRGIGRRLVERFEQKCRSRGVTRLEVGRDAVRRALLPGDGVPAVHRRAVDAELRDRWPSLSAHEEGPGLRAQVTRPPGAKPRWAPVSSAPAKASRASQVSLKLV